MDETNDGEGIIADLIPLRKPVTLSIRFIMMPSWLTNQKQSSWRRAIKQDWARWAKVDGDQRAAAFTHQLLPSLLPMVFILVSPVFLFVERELAPQDVA